MFTGDTFRRSGSGDPADGIDGTARRTSPVPGTVIFLFGRYFAGNADMLTRPGFKTIAPLNGVSPFSAAGDIDPEMQHYGEAERTNDRVSADVAKDLAARFARSGADYLVVDNTAALLWHRDVASRTYVVLHNEQTELTEYLCDEANPRADAAQYKVSRVGMTNQLSEAYDAFIAACLQHFDPERIVLVRSHAARFWVSPEGRIGLTDLETADARLLRELDDRFSRSTGCLISNATLSCFPDKVNWHAGGHAQRQALEEDLVQLCTPTGRRDTDGRDRLLGTDDSQTAADRVVHAVRRRREVDTKGLSAYLSSGTVSYDDLLALAFLHQESPATHAELVRDGVRAVLVGGDAFSVAETRLRFDRSVQALRRWKYRPRLPRRLTFTPQVSIRSNRHVFRFRDSGSVEQLTLARIGSDEAEQFADGADLDLAHLDDAVGSWPVYFARGRKGVTAAPTLTVPDVGALIDSCYWIDWESVLRNERVVIRARSSRRGRHKPQAKTDLSFVFDPAVRICTVGGGLMDQVTHIAMFHEICATAGVDYYLDDFRYTWWRAHNGFEASRLAPQLEQRRMTNVVSHALVESFRRDVMATRLPWVFNQSRFWHDNGLPEALVVTRNYFNSRRLMQLSPGFPVLVYPKRDDLDGLMTEPPAPVCFYTTQQRILIDADSAPAIRRVFSYQHLERDGLPADVAETAATLRASPHVALHVRRTDFLTPHFDTGGWYSRQDHYVAAIDHLIEHEFRGSNFDMAVFSDDLDFVDAHRSDYGLDKVTGTVRFVRGNSHYRSIFDSYLMALCPIVVGSVGYFAATTALLADAPSTLICARPDDVNVKWRRTLEVGPVA